MKKTFLFALFLLFSTVAFSQNVISLFGKAGQFFELLEGEKYTEAHQFFSETEQAKITADNLKDLWANIKTKFGKVQSIDPIRSKVQGDFYTVTCDGQFEKDAQEFVLVFDKAEKLVGIFMPPKAASYVPPTYADTTLYQEKSVYLTSGKHQLAAIITVPKKATNFPIVVLVHGSGPGDMDETVGPNKPLKDIAIGLATKGIGSVRYVKRTLVYPGEFNVAFTVKEEVTDDALAAVALAKTVKGADIKNIYLLGHSLGGMLAPRLSTLTPDLKGIIMLAAPARKLTDVIVEQNQYMFALAKDTTAAAKKGLQDVIASLGATRLTKLDKVKPDSIILGLPASYWIDLNNYDQVATAKKLTKRIFIAQGGNDFQITQNDYNLWNTALNKKPTVRLKFYPEINHLLSPQTAKGDVSQYQVPVNVSEQLITDMANWIKGK